MKTLLIAAGIAAGLFGIAHLTASQQRPASPVSPALAATMPTSAAKPQAQWAASAPGRVEPKGGDVRIGAQAGGRIVEIAVDANDRVMAGDLLLRLDDEDPRARVAATEAEAAARKRDRDAETVGRLAGDRRSAEDGAANAERALALARHEHDRILRAVRAGTGVAADLDKARTDAAAARKRLADERDNLRRAQAAGGVPLPTRLEAGLIAARADLSAAEAALERTRVRAPADGTILQLMARLGETASHAPEHVLVSMGDLSGLRVRADLEERDVGKVRVGQQAVVRADAYPGRDFEGRVATLAPGLAPATASRKGPRKPTDVDVLEVMLDLDGVTALLPGMRVDVFFRVDATAQPAGAPKAN